MSGGSVVASRALSPPRPFERMARHVVGGQPVQFLRRPLSSFRPPECCGRIRARAGGLFLQRLQTVARRLVLVHAGQPVAEQRALDIVLRRRARAVQLDGHQRFIDLSVQAQGAPATATRWASAAPGRARPCPPPRSSDSRLRTGQTQVLDRLVVEQQRIFWRARALDRQQRGKCALVSGQARAHPGSKRFGRRRAASLPGVKGLAGGSVAMFSVGILGKTSKFQTNKTLLLCFAPTWSSSSYAAPRTSAEPPSRVACTRALRFYTDFALHRRPAASYKAATRSAK